MRNGFTLLKVGLGLSKNIKNLLFEIFHCVFMWLPFMMTLFLDHLFPSSKLEASFVMWGSASWIRCSDPAIYPPLSRLVYLHRSVHEGQKISHEDRTPCSECNKDFYNKYTLEKHVREIHLKLKRFKCELCSNAFVRQNHLNVHIRKKHSKVENGKMKKVKKNVSKKTKEF